MVFQTNVTRFTSADRKITGKDEDMTDLQSVMLGIS
jgi:hypothetical protein